MLVIEVVNKQQFRMKTGALIITIFHVAWFHFSNLFKTGLRENFALTIIPKEWEKMLRTQQIEMTSTILDIFDDTEEATFLEKIIQMKYIS